MNAICVLVNKSVKIVNYLRKFGNTHSLMSSVNENLSPLPVADFPNLLQLVLEGSEPVFRGLNSLFFNKRFTKKVKSNKENTTDTALAVNNTW
jgi:hypothetical protein